MPREVVPRENTLVVRSDVQNGVEYKTYRQVLRVDFQYACAYCTMSEAEACGIRFTIDHFEPVSAEPEKENDYGNLMYSCDPCNSFKGDIYPPPDAREAGKRFFNAEFDELSQHFVLKGKRIEHLTPVGAFNIEMLELNRLTLQRIRDLRGRLDECHALVVGGMRNLATFPIDQLPANVRTKALSLIGKAS